MPVQENQWVLPSTLLHAARVTTDCVPGVQHGGVLRSNKLSGPSSLCFLFGNMVPPWIVKCLAGRIRHFWVFWPCDHLASQPLSHSSHGIPSSHEEGWHAMLLSCSEGKDSVDRQQCRGAWQRVATGARQLPCLTFTRSRKLFTGNPSASYLTTSKVLVNHLV